MRFIDRLAIGLLIALVILGALRERLPGEPGGAPFAPEQPMRRGAPAVPGLDAARTDADAFAQLIPPPPRTRIRRTHVIEKGHRPRRGTVSLGTAWALADSNAWLSARHVTDGCRSLQFLAGRLPSAIGHPSSDVSAIVSEQPMADGIAISRRPIDFDSQVFMVGYPSGLPTAVYGTVLGTGTLDHRGLGHRETVVIVAERRRSPNRSGDLGGISGGPVLDNRGNVVGTVIGGNARRARSIISTARNVGWLAAAAGGATRSSLQADAASGTLTPANFGPATASMLSDGPVRAIYCAR